MISFVYFDVGGVSLLDFSGTEKWKQMKHDLGVHDGIHSAFDALWKHFRDQICNAIDVDDLIPIIRKELGIQIPHDYSMLDDFVNRFEQNTSLWPVVDKIKKHTRIGLLTNMYPRMFDKIVKKKLLPPVEWDIIIDSSVVGYQKPERQIFEIAEQKANTKKSEILFVENSVEHVNAATEFGWQTFLYDPVYAEESSKKLLTMFSDNITLQGQMS